MAGRCAAWRSTRRRSTAWTRASAASSQALERNGQLDNTLVIFLADNGACAEDIPENVTVDELVDKLMIARSHTRSGEPVHFGNDPHVMPGPENTYQSYGTAWANLSNTPFRLYKHWIHEGGIATPLIVHWPNGIAATQSGGIRHTPGYLPDIMATIARRRPASTYPATFDRPRGRSARRARRCCRCCERPRRRHRPPMFWEHEGNAAVRIGKWKLVRKATRATGSSTTWTPTAPSCTTSPRSIPSASATWRRSTTRGRSAAA